MEILASLGIAWTGKNPRIRCPFPDHHDENPSWRWDDAEGRCHCTCEGGGGDIIDVAGRMRGTDFKGALDYLSDVYLGAEAASVPSRKKDLKPDRPDATGNAERAVKLWERAKPLAGTLGAKYLEEARGIVLDAWPSPIRFSTALHHPGGKTFPAIIAGLSAEPGGEVKAIGRIWLGEDGYGKAEVDEPKAALGSIKGLAVWLGTPGGRLVICEGLENALSVLSAGEPFVCAAFTGGNVANVKPPSCVKDVIIFADRSKTSEGVDQVGLKAITKGRKAWRQAGVSVHVTVTNAPHLDANDALRDVETGGAEEIRRLLAVADGRRSVQAGRKEDKTAAVSLPDGFSFTRDGGVIHESGMFICTPVRFLAMASNAEGVDWGLWVAVKTERGDWKEVMIKQEDIQTSDEYVRLLARNGLRRNTAAPAKALFKDLFAMVRIETLAICADRVGWVGEEARTFKLPDDAFGETAGETVIFTPKNPPVHYFRTKGTLEEWRREVAARAIGNSRLILGVAVAFMGPLLHPLGMEGGGFHLRGPSSKGKTTALHAGGSVWGGGGKEGFARNWRTTDNALEGIAAMHSDTFLALDEMGQATAKAAANSIYMLGNGVGKSRARPGGETVTPASWRICFLSTGEVSLASKIAEDGGKAMAGQEVRFIDLEADAGAGMGAFENCHGMEPDAFSKAIKAGAFAHYGHASRAFLQRLAEDVDGASRKVKARVKELARQMQPAGADGQVSRAVERFALAAEAAELAAEWGILPWPEGTARAAMTRMFDEWLAARGGVGALEFTKALEQVRAFIQAHETSRFAPWTEPNRVTINRVGLIRRKDAVTNKDLMPTDQTTNGTKTTAYIFNSAFENEVCKGIDHRVAAKALREIGALVMGKDGKNAKPTLPSEMELSESEARKPRCYAIDVEVLFSQ
jgi:putative DNA primase/helicase